MWLWNILIILTYFLTKNTRTNQETTIHNDNNNKQISKNIITNALERTAAEATGGYMAFYWHKIRHNNQVNIRHDDQAKFNQPINFTILANLWSKADWFEYDSV